MSWHGIFERKGLADFFGAQRFDKRFDFLTPCNIVNFNSYITKNELKLLSWNYISGPGTIFLMLVGAFVAAFKIGNWQSFQYNLVPIVVYTATCLLLKPKWQLLLSQMLSTFYALIMMAVIVGTALQLGEDGIGSPSAIFLMAMVGSFFIAACLHPQEFWCVVPGLIYLLCIPSMYLLLIIYRYF